MSDSLTFRLLRYIKAATETLNFTRAAEQVFVAQSSLSSQIGKFEDTVDLLLFVRLQNGLKLTSAGRIVATFAENTLREWDQTLAMALAVQRNEVPPLRLGFSSFINAKLLERFRENYEGMFPGCVIHLWSGDPLLCLQRLDARALDCAIIPLPADATLYNVQQIAQSPLVVCMRSDDVLADRAQLDIHEVAGRITIFRDPELHPSAHTRLVEMFKEVGIPIHLACAARTPSEIQWMVKERYGLALIDQLTPLDPGIITRPIAGVNWTADTHAIIFNVTEREDGSTRAIQERTFFESQNYATAVYQSVLTHQLRKLGYEIEPGQSGAPEILGFTQAYLDASSPRSRQIKEQMERTGFQGPEAAQIAAHATRDRKQTLTASEVLAAHKEMAKDFGDQPERVIAAARERALIQAQEISVQPDSRGAVAFAKEKVFEREAVADERVIMREALRRGMGEVSFSDVQSEFQRRQAEGEFRSVQGQKYASGRSFTTPETIADERANVQHVLNGQGASAPMLSTAAAGRQATSREFLNEAQQTAIREVLTSTDRVHGFQGLAGTGKTSTLAAIREGAEQGGYKVEGFAPTSKAAGQLREAGIEANTLQSFLARQKDAGPVSRHLYMLDESSLASTKQMRAFLEKIHLQDRVLVIGDTRQHQGVDAGRPFQQMQEAGMQTSKLDTIMRQKDPELLRAVQYLATSETEKGIALLSEQGRVTELANASERIAAIARDYAARPENTLIVSPDNRSRQQINEAVRGELLKAGTLSEDGRQFLTLSHRSDMTGPDRTWAAMYRTGDVVQYERGSRAEGIERGSFGVVRSSNATSNRLTVEFSHGSSVEYDPKRVYGVNVYRETSREFATGDRLQFSAIHKDLGISNRDMGTITKMEPDRLTVLMDGNEQRSVSFNPTEFRQFDHGYAVTSHSSQGLTADRVIANIDTESSRSLINNRLAYVAISRASEDARIYTNDAATLGQRLATDVTKTAALEFTAKPESPATQEVSKARAIAVHEYNSSDSRLAAVATEYVSRPGRSIIVALDRAEREELTQIIRADLYAHGKLGRDAQAISVLIEKETGSKMLAESYQPGDKIQYKTGSPGLDGIPHDSQGTVVSTTSRGNLLSVRFDATREEVTYDPAQLRTQTRESSVFQEETRAISQGERVRFATYDKEMGVRSGDLGTVTRIGEDHAMTVKMDSGKIAEVSLEKAQHIDYGYVVDSLKNVRAERVIATGDGLTQQAFQAASAKADLALYTSPPQQEFASSKEIAITEFAQPTKQQNDFGIGF